MLRSFLNQDSTVVKLFAIKHSILGKSAVLAAVQLVLKV